MAEKSFNTIKIPGEVTLNLDIFTPGANANRVAVVLLHGGAWRFGDRTMMHPYAELLSTHGFVAVCAQYRLVGEAPWPAQIDDVVATIDWIAANAAQLGVRADRIVVQGFSAGGHLALLAGARAKNIGAVVAFFAPPLMIHETPRPAPHPKDMLLGPEADAAAIEQASPLRQITRGYPPTFLLAGVEDRMTTTSDQIALFQRLRAEAVTAEMHLFSGHTHEFSALPSMLAPVQSEVALFLQRNVVDPGFYIRENQELNMFAAPGGPRMPPPGPSNARPDTPNNSHREIENV